MSPEPNAVEQAVARALRDNLERLQSSSEDLTQAVNDVVAACSSSKPTNALPPMLRAQSMAASLSASLEVLSRFIAMALQPGPRSLLEEKITQAIGSAAPEPPPAPVRPMPGVPAPKAAEPVPAPEPGPASMRQAPVAPASQAAAPSSTPPPAHVPAPTRPPVVESNLPVEPDVEAAVSRGSEFDINQLTPEEQELHRRANRVAKVSMQDIKMLRPEQVKQGREHKDICIRLKDDIEKAHREYDRRFKPIMDHPVDYFYRWMVEILAEGDASALGEYPYAVASKTR
jgi:hypothetical protein